VRALIFLILLTVPCRADYVLCSVQNPSTRVAHITSELQEAVDRGELCLAFARRFAPIDLPRNPWQVFAMGWKEMESAQLGLRAYRDHWSVMEKAGWAIRPVDE
jgi:hypothetical protein